MAKVLRRDSTLLMVGSSYRKKTKALWELDEKPEKEDGTMYYEVTRIGRTIYKQ